MCLFLSGTLAGTAVYLLAAVLEIHLIGEKRITMANCFHTKFKKLPSRGIFLLHKNDINFTPIVFWILHTFSTLKMHLNFECRKLQRSV